ncbi:GNAT family N-acetyltransferase [Candidatus Thorarchaeota archaeon]|nr:MAG: GNAT family N-acetyltransferase [Candidatus Thorarchaeota archaeon]
MTLEIYEKRDREDMDFFFKLGFWAMKTHRRAMFEQIMRDHPDATDDEAFEIHKREATEYMDFSKPEVRIFVASEGGQRCGYLWIAPRNSEDMWDLEQPQWIYDIVVDPQFQGQGIGQQLMKVGEEYAKSLPSNVGLFVHSDNEPAISLYKKMQYSVKAVPVSKKVVDAESSEGGSFIIREIEGLPQFLRDLEYDRFRKMVLFSANAEEEEVRERFERHLGRSEKVPGKYRRFAAFTNQDQFLGAVWVGPSGFHDDVAQIHSFVLGESKSGQEPDRFLVHRTEIWTKSAGFSTLYILLHSEDDLEIETLQSMGYSVPGFFMEKRLR